MFWSLTYLSLQHCWFSERMCNHVWSYNHCNVHIDKIHVCLHLEKNETNGWYFNCKNCYNSSNFYDPTYPSFHMVSITASTYNSGKFVQDNDKAKTYSFWLIKLSINTLTECRCDKIFWRLTSKPAENIELFCDWLKQKWVDCKKNTIALAVVQKYNPAKAKCIWFKIQRLKDYFDVN